MTGGNVGDEITDADANTNATSLIDSVFEAIQKLDEKMYHQKVVYVS